MEKILDKTNLIINENEKVIANILHDIKSPLYSIKIGLRSQLNSELNKEVFNTVVDVLDYIEKFLVNYSFKLGKFENKISPCDIKTLISKKLDDYKQIFIDKNICIDFVYDNCEYKVNTILIFLSSIIGNIISNIAFHASSNKNAYIELHKKTNCISIVFENFYDERKDGFSLGLDFSRKLAQTIKTDIKYVKTKDKVSVELKIPNKI